MFCTKLFYNFSYNNAEMTLKGLTHRSEFDSSKLVLDISDFLQEEVQSFV